MQREVHGISTFVLLRTRMGPATRIVRPIDEGAATHEALDRPRRFLPIRLSGANLQGADLTGADLTNASLRGANLTGAITTGVNFARADSRDCIGCPAS
jgi:uncharacterized protein YjbI with pentapeptide repeats